MAGLPSSYMKRFPGDLKKAWAAYRADGHAKKGGKSHKKHHGGGGGGGGGAAAGGTPGESAIRVSIGTHTLREYNRRELAAIVEGIVQQFRQPKSSREEFFEAATPEEERIERHYRSEKELGRELAIVMGPALAYLGVSGSEFGQWVSRAIAESGVRPGHGGGGGMGVQRWTSPLAGPSSITSQFGEGRDGGELHSGIDLRAAHGSPVTAVADLQVHRVGRTTRGGLEVVASVRRPDGTYPEQLNDIGWRVTYSHLADATVQPGDLVPQFSVVGHSGGDEPQGIFGSGHSTGPHLHFQVEWVGPHPAALQTPTERLFVNPVGLIDDVIPVGAESGNVEDAVVETYTDGVALPRANASDTKGGVVVNIGIANGAVISIGDINLTGLGGLFDAAANKAGEYMQTASDYYSGQGSIAQDTGIVGMGLHRGVSEGLLTHWPGILDSLPELLQGVGQFAGNAFRVITDPQVISRLLTLTGAASGLAGGLLGAAGAAIGAATPLLVLIPEPAVSKALAGAAPVAAGVLGLEGLFAGGAGTALAGAGRIVSGLTSEGQPPPPPSPGGGLNQLFSSGQPGPNPPGVSYAQGYRGRGPQP